LTKRLLSIISVLVLAATAWAGALAREVDKMLEEYFKIQTSLAGDSTAGVDSDAQAILQIAEGATASDPKLVTILSNIRKAAREIQGKDLERTREQFFELSKPFLAYLHQFHSAKGAYYRYYCPHANKAWVQQTEEIRNPYFGSSMLTCGEIIK
jgi:hypothetical protein